MKYTILDYLEETANKYPDKTAFADVNSSVTWAEFVERAKQKSAIIAKYFEPGMAVPVMIDKSVKTLEYFFGALYAGCFYSYFDATFPDERLNSMISTLGVKHIIADSRFEKKLSNLNVTPLFYKNLEEEKVEYTEARRRSIIDTDPVYANFTSGSTGTPKAVVVSHRSVIDFISIFTEIFGIESSDNIANQAPFDFDVSVKDIFSGVFTGATVHLVPKMFFSFPTKLLDYLEEREITILIWAVSALCIVSTLNGFDYKVPKKLRKVMFSGEVMPIKQLEIWKKFLPDTEYINLYGPTEITCNCTYFRIPFEADLASYTKGIPMGIPFPNERILLLDENNNLVTDADTEGEVCVSGTCVALGYYNNEKTAEVFVQNPNNKSTFERIYKTGDLATFGTDGNYYYIGRKDTQIKHMGHRIELGEIENAIAKHEFITRACCIFADNKITAFYTGKETEKKEIVTLLKVSLPVYMVPSDFIFIEEFPLTKNGKIDKRALTEKLNACKD
ncbi:amino acid adenylation domain-containing protein [uncultured Treponema sp.]|uniref:amino acid adenylation domain-containing protein n=1 Tax=uncultured Treponema sp. TaxID=162155 RepID=UPI0025FF9878|nr:amino acid adenylation domain-containing protein [uncultured Treponema sp.]